MFYTSSLYNSDEKIFQKKTPAFISNHPPDIGLKFVPFPRRVIDETCCDHGDMPQEADTISHLCHSEFRVRVFNRPLNT